MNKNLNSLLFYVGLLSIVAYQSATAQYVEEACSFQAEASEAVDAHDQTHVTSNLLHIEDLKHVGTITTSTHKPSIYKDADGQSWFIKKTTLDGMLTQHICSQFLQFLYPERFAQSRLIAGHPDLIASKMIPHFLAIPDMVKAHPNCEMTETTICNQPILGVEELISIIEFLGLSDNHILNMGFIQDADGYKMTMIDYDVALGTALNDILKQGPCATPSIPDDFESTISYQETALTRAYSKIADLTDEDIRSVLLHAIHDFKENNIWINPEKTIQLDYQLRQSRDRIHDKIEAQIIIQAVLNDDFDGVKAYLEQRLVNSIFDYEGTSLIRIAQAKGSDAMKALIQEVQQKHNLKSPNTTFCGEQSYLMQMVQEGNLVMVRKLIEAGADINVHPHLLVSAIQSNQLEMVQLLINDSRMTPDSSTNMMYTLGLQTAIAKNNLSMVRLFLDHPHTYVNLHIGGLSPLMTAIEKINIEAMELLLQHPSIDLNLFMDPIIMLAVKYHNLSALELFIKHPQINVNLGRPLAIAVEKGNLKALRLLLDHPDIDVNLGHPLAMAIQEGNSEAVRLLLNHPHIDVNTDNFLLMAIEQSNLEAFQLLIEHPHLHLNSDQASQLLLAAWRHIFGLKSSDRVNSLGIIALLLDYPEISVDLAILRQHDRYNHSHTKMVSDADVSELLEAYFKKHPSLSQTIMDYLADSAFFKFFYPSV